MTSKRQLILEAVKTMIVAALPYADVKRNQQKPDELAPGGFVNILDGDPGEPEVDLSPLTYNYQHRIPLEVAGFPTGSLADWQISPLLESVQVAPFILPAPPNELPLDVLLQAIGAAVAANRGLGGLVDFLEVEAPDTDNTELPGSDTIRWADTALIAHYATPDPLG